VTYLVDLTQDRTEAGGERIPLLGQERVARLRTLQTGLCVRQRHSCGKDVLAIAGHGCETREREEGGGLEVRSRGAVKALGRSVGHRRERFNIDQIMVFQM
jgi:hypothetical protein